MNNNNNTFLIAISRAIKQRDFENAKKILNQWNFNVNSNSNIISDYLGYSGNPKERAHQLNEAFKSGGNIFSVMGGMGAVHILKYLDLDLISESDSILIGYSDLTILLNFLNESLGKRCLHGPNLGKDIKEFDKKTIICLFDAINKKNYQVRIKEKDIVVSGKSKAKICGGNLALIQRSLATPYEIDTDNKIIFMEAVDKDPQWVFDTFWQLKLAGKFDNVKGVILGHFTRCGENIDKYLKEFFKDFKCPIIMNQPIGHEEPNLTISIGEKCIINTDKLFWGIKFN
jgi:muramoyltetrapeptide carboxypeptidase